ncbi:bifunctional lysylphosphatidylglycerol synthetase/lysine--tRNA ligase LysX [Cryptosporangium phraense]|uniref:Lysine--tRNA ligase n=1 Tax=Cryptosporangium phraense TaxID=2593070 RepID=A0A545ARN3_9ACTN|nr:bifunctional lysylphosphatidylglycerol synthetase/lysine--tRNA ligase LysX [Cryptosporangium phraense]TQS44004.1 bifunctional lysylphosphatidylglycerol synthetase/lysine--tRNA ligase LysX [Cryptosporangium phraense]
MSAESSGSRHWPDRVAAWSGRLVTIAGVWLLLSLPLRRMRWAHWVDYAFGLLNVPTTRSLFVIVGLLLLGSALRRRLRAALWLAIAAQLIAAPTQVLVVGIAAANWDDLDATDLDLTRLEVVLTGVAAAVGLALAVLLWRARSAFPAHLAPFSRRAALAVLASGLIASWALTFGLTELFPRTLHGTREKLTWANRSAFGFTAAGDRAGLNGHLGHHWVAALGGTLSAIALLAAVAVFLRAARAAQFLGADDELTVRRLLLESGDRDSLGYFATRRDKSVIFSPDGRAAITYRVVASVSLASADPIGHPASWPAAIDAWLADARAHGWFPAVLSASENGAAAYVGRGLKALSLGDEAIVEVEDFTLEGRTMRPVRQAVTRIRRAGYTLTARRHSEVAPEEWPHLELRAHAWRGDAPERGFSMALGRFGDPSDDRCVLVTAHDAGGEVRGLLSFVPWGARGLSLDLMRRDRTAENGLNEFMVAGLIEAAPSLAVRRISLNFAMFRAVFSAGDQIGAGPVTRLTDAVLSVASRFWQLESLYRSNAKYLPTWLPRFVCFDSSLTLTRAAIAAGIAEGFLPGIPPRTRALEDGFADEVRKQDDELLRPAHPQYRLNQQQSARRAKAELLARNGHDPYPVTVPRTATLAEIRAAHPGLPPNHRTGVTTSVTGRVRALRDLGGVSFGVLQDDGVTLQVMLTADGTPRSVRELWKQTVDLGDHVGVTGEVVTSERGELSVLADDWTMAAKCLRPLPDAHAGFSDPEARVRQRYLDLLVNADAMQVLQQRSVAVRALRDAFAQRGFTEVETPMLQAVHGGAAARPFRTHINAYDTDLYLRIAPELYLKRLCVAGMPRVFELNRNFRNEGVDATHNPEFTSLEAYQAYADYTDMRELTRALILEVATAVHGAPIAVRPSGPVDLSGSWPVVTVHDAISAATGTALAPDTPLRVFREVCARHSVHAPADATPGELAVELYDALVEKNTTYPTFYTDFPLDTSPLTRAHRDDRRLAERWDLVAYGAELGTAYSELVDPVDQRERLTAQSIKAAAGDPEAMQIDESFLTALEYAMPPTGGLGLGVDRLVMFLTGTNIRATLAFPFSRPVPSS